ncbi:MAG: hypothetical protein AAFZ15_03370 [Bacteroidota bacterium]
MLNLIRTVNGKYEEIELGVWLWVVINLLPGAVLLLISTARYRLPQKIIPSAIHQALWGGTLVYFILIYLTILAEVQVVGNGYALGQYFLLSFTWLLPVQGLILVSYFLVFYSKARIARPNNRNILELAGTKAKAKGLSAKSRKCFDLIAQGKLKEAFQMANQNAYQDLEKSQLNELLLLSSQFASVSRDFTEENIQVHEAQIEFNRLSVGLMNLAEYF